jgi:outer membrane protein, multidrug efflux system
MKSYFPTQFPALLTASGATLLLLLAGCAVGPDYKRPVETVPPQYKAETLGSWKEGRPLDQLPKDAWWEVFADGTLNDLQHRAAAANQELKAAVARVEQARDTARVARSELLPTLNADPSFQRQRYSPNQVPSFGPLTANRFSVPLDLSYEVDLWGRVRRGFESARADAQASLAAFHNVLLTLHSDVAQNYFSLRALDAEIATVTGTVGLRKEQVQLVRNRLDAGIGDELDVARAQTELASAEADDAALARRRAELENALAILIGENPATFRLAAASPNDGVQWNPPTPQIPAGLPADLLERRPDVSEAERQLAAANARIGIAKAAFFPVVTLTGSGGYVSGDIDSLFNWNSRAWSFGPSVSLPIFAGGRNRANFKRSQSAYEESIANYRQRILVAFGDVENSLAGIHHLADQAGAQDRAVASARRAADLAQDRYRSGIVSYLEVVDANREALQAERSRAQLTGLRLSASVQLIKALGGGWSERQLFAKAPSPDSLPPRSHD